MEKNNEFKAILYRLKREQGLSMRKVAEMIGLSYTYLSDVSCGRSEYTDTLHGKMAQTFGDYIADNKPTPPEKKLYGGRDEQEQDEPMVTLPLIPLECVAGFPTLDNDGISLADCERYAVPEFSARGAEFLVRVSGTSMYPRFNHGDILACKRVTRMTFFQWGMVYVIDTEQGMLVKRLYECPDDADTIMCHSENADEFPPFRLPKSEIRSVSIVVGQISVS